MAVRSKSPAKTLTILASAGLALGLGALGFAGLKSSQATATTQLAASREAKWQRLTNDLWRVQHELGRAQPGSGDVLGAASRQFAEALKDSEFANRVELRAAGDALHARIQDFTTKGQAPAPRSAREILPQAGSVMLKLEAEAEQASAELAALKEGAEVSASAGSLLLGLGGALLILPSAAYLLLFRHHSAREREVTVIIEDRVGRAVASAQAELATFRQQTERERQQLLRAEKRVQVFGEIIECSSMILWAMDTQGRFTFREGRALSDFGQQSGDGVGMLWSELPCGRPGSPDDLARALAGECFSSEYNEGERWYNTRFSPIKNREGAITGLSGVSVDITHRKRAEQVAIQEEGIRQATRLKSEFMANMSHELRTPMNGIVGMVGLLGCSGLSEEQQGMLDVIQSSTDSLLKTVNDIIDLSKLESGKVKLAEAEFVPYALLHEILSAQAPAANRKGIEIVTDLDAGTHSTVLGDPDRFRQVVSNIVDNGVKYTPKGHVLLQVRSAAQPDGRIQISVTVSDTGTGIEKARIPTLLKPYNSSGGVTTRKVGDAGFGISLTKMVLDLMGGTIAIDSEPGRGTKVDLGVTMGLKVNARPTPINELPFCGKRVLVVDDNEVVRGILALKLAGWGADVDVAPSSSSALASCQERQEKDALYDLVLVDRYMPSVDGAGFASKVRANSRYADLPLVLLDPAVDPLEPSKLALFQGDIRKPIDDLALRNVVTEALARSRTRAARPAAEPAPVEVDNSPLRILVADDNLVNRTVCKKMLQKLGHTVDVVENGEEVLAALASQYYDGVLMDCQMPVIDGYEATRRIRAATAHWRDIWIVAVTANASVADRQNCLDAGMNDFVPKPLRIQVVEATLTKLRRERALAAAG